MNFKQETKNESFNVFASLNLIVILFWNDKYLIWCLNLVGESMRSVQGILQRCTKDDNQHISLQNPPWLMNMQVLLVDFVYFIAYVLD